MADTAQSLRAELKRRRPRRSGDGFPPDLRARAGTWIRDQQAAGVTATALAVQLGISTASVRTWSTGLDPMKSDDTERFLPVVVQSPGKSASGPAGAVLHTPGGYRVSGLGLDELLTLLRGLE